MTQFPQIMLQFCWQLGSLHIVPFQIICSLSSQKQKRVVGGYPILTILILEIMNVEGYYYCISFTGLILVHSS